MLNKQLHISKINISVIIKRDDKMKIMLTGAAGNVGLETLKCLISNKHDVTVLELPNKKNRQRLKPFCKLVKIIYGSINDERLVKRLVDGQDAIIHLAAIIPPLADRLPKLTEQVNFEGTKNIIEAIKTQEKMPTLIFSSSISVYGDRVANCWIKVGDPLKPSVGDHYAQIKIKTEELIQSSMIPYVIFRLTGIMGYPATDPLMFHMPLATKIEFASNVDTGFAFSEALDHLAELEGHIYDLGGGAKFRITYQAFLNKMLSIYGLDYRYLNDQAFADQNFHCAYFADSDVLNDILHFQRDDLNSYYQRVKAKTNPLIKMINRLLSRPIIYFLQNRSEPLQAKKQNNKELIKRFYK